MVAPGTANAAQPPSWATVTPSTWVTTDSKQPHRSITTGDARVGAWRDDKHHIGKSYFTFDISRFKGTQLFTASLRTPEKAANDCTKPRATQLWVVKPQEKITWAHQPWEITKVEQFPNEDCISPWLGWNVAEPIKKALERGKTEITFVLRIEERFQGKTEYGRTYDPAASITASFNTPPGTPTDLTIANQKCDGTPIYFYDRQPQVTAIAHDADGVYGLEGRLAFWPVNAPEQRVESGLIWAGGGYISSWFPAGMVQDGGTYAFAARGEDGTANSEWSAPCQFTADLTPPATAPAISSTTYRENAGPPGDGGEGLPGDFTFDAKGDKDIIAFAYDGIGVYGRVDADAPGGKATIAVTPTSDGPMYISVRGIDKAGHVSPAMDYRYWVRTTAPYMTHPYFEIGEPREIEFTANQDGATRFVYQLDAGPEQSLPVGEDGKARTTFVFPEPGQDRHEFKLWTVNGTGVKSGVTDNTLFVNQAQPWIDVEPWWGPIGLKRTFTVTPNRENVVSYVYKIADEPEKQVPADADGSLTFEYTPEQKGDFPVLVASVNAKGIRSGWGESSFLAEAPAPNVTSAEYPEYGETGAPGLTGTFKFTSQLPIVTYKYRWNDGPEQTTTDAQVQWTPTRPGYYYLSVFGVTASGVETERRSYSFRVKAFPPTLTSPQYPEGGPVTARPNQPIEFVVTPNLPGSHEVLLNFHWGGTPQVLPVGEDGKARFTHTVTSSQSFYVTVSSRTPNGLESGSIERGFHVPPQ
ncbi:hypothetical protein LFM09_09325 [Lentzea alba]|uniref:hypothetical protein n=1 Tax=Lentzea alba TaxID=2714351 RepID=UPI0039BED679